MHTFYIATLVFVLQKLLPWDVVNKIVLRPLFAFGGEGGSLNCRTKIKFHFDVAKLNAISIESGSEGFENSIVKQLKLLDKIPPTHLLENQLVFIIKFDKIGSYQF